MKKLISRQRRWQLKKKEEGKCTICGKAPVIGSFPYCAEHKSRPKSGKTRSRIKERYALAREKRKAEGPLRPLR